MRCRQLLSALLLMALSVAARGEVIVTRPYRGITLLERSESQPRPEHMHILQIDLADPAIHFKLSPARPIGGSETTGQTTLDFLVQERAQAAVNGHFFEFPLQADGGTNITGFAASLGQVYSAFESRPALAYAILPNAPALNMDEGNHAVIALRGTTESLLVDADTGRPVSPYNTLSGSAQIITRGVVTIPAGLSPRPKTRPADPDVSFYTDQVAARTAIGLSRDGRTLLVFTVDAAGGSAGMTVSEMAGLLWRDYGVYNALNLDGGGSTTLAMQIPETGRAAVINAASGGPRAVGSNLAIFAEPVGAVSTIRVVPGPRASGTAPSSSVGAPGSGATTFSATSIPATQIGTHGSGLLMLMRQISIGLGLLALAALLVVVLVLYKQYRNCLALVPQTSRQTDEETHGADTHKALASPRKPSFYRFCITGFFGSARRHDPRHGPATPRDLPHP